MERTRLAAAQPTLSSIRTISILMTIQVIAVTLYLLGLPSSSKGFSTPRIVSFALLALVGLVLVLWILLLFIKPVWLKGIIRWLDKTLKERNPEIIIFTALATSTGIFLGCNWVSLPETYETQVALPRLIPVLALFTLTALETLLLALLSNNKSISVRLNEMIATPGRFTRLLVIVIVMLALLSTLGQIVKYAFPSVHRFIDFLVVNFFLDSEMNIPTFFSALLTLGCAGTFAWISWQTHLLHRPYTFHWAILSALFILLTIDEIVSLHEKLTSPMQDHIYAVGLLYWPWFLPILPVLAGLFFVYLRFFLKLPRRTFWLFMLSAGVYLGSSIVLEAVGAAYADEYGLGNFTYTILSTIEESAEMGGLVLMLYTLLDYNRSVVLPGSLHHTTSVQPAV